MRGEWAERGRSAGPSGDQADFFAGLLVLLDDESFLDPFDEPDLLSALVEDLESDFVSDFESDFVSDFESEPESDFDSDRDDSEARDLAREASRLSVL